MMGRFLLIAALLGVTVAAPAGAQTAAPAEQKAGSIRGRVTAADTGRPLRRARVTLRAVDTTRPQVTVYTNSLGQFHARTVPPGRYIVAAFRSGYLSLQYGQRVSTEPGLTVEVKPAQAVNDIDLTVPRGGVIGGRITDDLGEPFPGVRVELLRLRFDKGRRVPSPTGGTSTDDLGQFRLAGIPPGSYYVVASSTETWKTERNEVHGYGSTYFPGTSVDRAQTISIAASEQRTDLNFTMQAGRAARVAGRVQRENGEPVVGAPVQLAYSYPGVIMVGGSRNVRTVGDGSFEFKDVPAGTYMVGGGSADQIITVAGADIEDIVLVPKSGSTVTGALVTEEGTPPPFPSSGVAVLLSAPFGKTLPTVYVNSVSPDWTFKLSGLGGPFMFRLMGLPEDWTLASVRLDEKDITDMPWEVPTGGKEFSGLKMVVTRKIGRLSGMVQDARGNPTSAAAVMVFSEDADHWIPDSRYVKTVRPGADGRFSLRDLPAGTYRVVAREFIEEGQHEDKAFLESIRDEGVRVVLADGGSESVTLRLRDK